MINYITTPLFAEKNELTTGSVRIPFIANGSFRRIMERFDAFTEVYNKAVNTMRSEAEPKQRIKYQTIKSVHRALFEDLVNQVKGQMAKQRHTFEDNERFLSINPCNPYVLSTNRVIIGKRTGKDGATVWRNIQRLIDAGVIVHKVNHGSRANFELHINPAFLLISDATNTDYVPIELSNNDCENTLFGAVLLAKCTPKEKDLNILNNIINDVENPHLEGVASNPCTRADKSIYKSKGKLSDFDLIATNEEKKKPKNGGGECCEVAKAVTYAEKMQKNEENIARRIELYSQWLVQLLIKTIFPNHKHFQGAIDKAYEFAAIYFTGCKTAVEFDNRMTCLMWRVDAAARWINRTNYKMNNQFVHTYLDPGNKTTGFSNTLKWWNQHKTRERKREEVAKAKKIKTDRMKLMQAVAIVDNAYINLSPSKLVAVYKEQEGYVKRNIPYLLPDFYSITEYVRNNRYPKTA